MLDCNALKVLLVDDEIVILDLLRHILVDRGAQVTTATDGRAALDALEQQPFDVVISDFRMPKLNGISLLESIRNVRSSSGSPAVILISGYKYLQSDEVLDKGAAALFSKPLPYERLIELTRRYGTPANQRWATVADQKAPKEALKVVLGDGSNLSQASQLMFGKGGFFIQVESPFLEPGEVVGLDISFKNGAIPSFQGVGEVRWVRTENSSLALAGYGIEILSLTDESRERLVEYVEAQTTMAFIPLGNRAA